MEAIQEKSRGIEFSSPENRLIALEKAALDAFKHKDRQAFTRDFGNDYIGVANDGVKDANGELEGMQQLNLTALLMADEKVSFPSEDTAIITYKMMTAGTMRGENFSGSIYCSTVYLKRKAGWQAVLHTESRA